MVSRIFIVFPKNRYNFFLFPLIMIFFINSVSEGTLAAILKTV